MIVKSESVPLETLKEGMQRKILARGGRMMVVEVKFIKGTNAEVHSHSHEQVGYVLKGSFELEMGGEKEIIHVGDSYYVPPHVLHGVFALEDGDLLDIFTPQREDFLTQ